MHDLVIRDARLLDPQGGTDRSADVLVEDGVIRRIADARTLALRIFSDLPRHIKVGGRIDIGMADTFVVLDHRNMRHFRDGLD